jgi:hypothetical protein
MAACKKFSPFTSLIEIPIFFRLLAMFVCLDWTIQVWQIMKLSWHIAGYVSGDKIFENFKKNVGVCYYISEIHNTKNIHFNNTFTTSSTHIIHCDVK